MLGLLAPYTGTVPFRVEAADVAAIVAFSDMCLALGDRQALQMTDIRRVGDDLRITAALVS